MENPIQNNRIVHDITFARRLISHLNDTNAECPMGAEEIEYLKFVANRLLNYQIKTSPDNEIAYHESCENNNESCENNNESCENNNESDVDKYIDFLWDNGHISDAELFKDYMNECFN